MRREQEILTILTVIIVISIGEVVAEEKGERRSGNALLVDDDVASGLAGKSTSRVACSGV